MEEKEDENNENENEEYEEEEDDEEEEGEEVEDVNEEFKEKKNFVEDFENQMDEENELSDEIFNLKEEEIKSNQKIKITYDTNKKESEATSLDKSIQLYKNNFNISKPKKLGKVKVLLYFRNTPILVLTESSN